ncbi:hypothetical protein B7486_61770, partial [cyanobacterium TDX16]
LIAEAAVPKKPEEEKKLPPLAEGLRAAQAVKGGFSAAALNQQFGISSEAQKQTEVLKQIAANLKEQPGKIGEAVGDELKMK